MAKNRRNLYDWDSDEPVQSSDSKQRKQTSKHTSSDNSSSDIDAISRNLESGADEHIRRNRRDTRYEKYNGSSRSRRASSSAASEMNTDDREEFYRKRKKAREEVARWKRAHWIIRFLIVLVLILDILFLRFGVFKGGFMPVWNIIKSGSAHQTEGKPGELQISEQYLTPNTYSRPETPLEEINGIVIHYTCNPGSDVQDERDYYESLKDGVLDADGNYQYGSCNYIVGLDGSIIHCVPDNEVAYASLARNYDTLSIEYCHPDESGAMTQETYQSLVLLTAKLCKENKLSADQVIRHYDINHERNCPRFFVEDPDSWSNFIESVKSCM